MAQEMQSGSGACLKKGAGTHKASRPWWLRCGWCALVGVRVQERLEGCGTQEFVTLSRTLPRARQRAEAWSPPTPSRRPASMASVVRSGSATRGDPQRLLAHHTRPLYCFFLICFHFHNAIHMSAIGKGYMPNITPGE